MSATSMALSMGHIFEIIADQQWKHIDAGNTEAGYVLQLVAHRVYDEEVLKGEYSDYSPDEMHVDEALIKLGLAERKSAMLVDPDYAHCYSESDTLVAYRGGERG